MLEQLSELIECGAIIGDKKTVSEHLSYLRNRKNELLSLLNVDVNDEIAEIEKRIAFVKELLTILN